MVRLNFRPRKTFERHLRYLGKLDPTIVDEVRAAIDILLEGEELPEDFGDHGLKRKLSNYHEFHVRDTPKGEKPTEINDVVVIYKIEFNDLVLVAVDVGSHTAMFSDSHKTKYRKTKSNLKDND